MRHGLFLLLLILFTSVASAQPLAKVETALNYNALHPGQQAALAVIVTIPEGYHSQSSTPSGENFIAFALTSTVPESIKTLPPVYPKGKDVTYPALGKLNVYNGRVIVYLPLQVSSVAAPGEVQLAGKVRLQMCDDQTCFPPANLPFGLTVPIVATDTPVATANPELFSGFDPRVFAAGVSETGPPAGAEIQVFGWNFRLEQGAYVLAFGLALAVGVIFNLMPCVLPVLPLKAIGFYEASQHNRLRCFLLGVVFSLGLLAVFAVLAVLIVVQKQAWGELFASGWFVWTIVVVLVVMAVGQLGGFSLVLPAGLYNHVPDHSSWLGNFLFGGFAAILSTPCTAPMFVGLLVWSAGQPTWLGIAIIMTVGLGMALPYLVLAAFPQLARRVPRTGAWSELLKQFMGFLLLAVAAYFAAGRLISGNSYLWIVFAIVLMASAFLVVRTRALSRTPRALITAGTIGLLLSGVMLYLTLKLTGGANDLIPWQPYSQQAFDDAIQEGRTVMLEFTANWCANCKELESRVFTDRRAADAIKDRRVLPMRADLTHEDAPGWDHLKKLNPSGGIPLTAIYSPAWPQPIQLSSIYTTDNLIAALEAASQTTTSSTPR